MPGRSLTQCRLRQDSTRSKRSLAERQQLLVGDQAQARRALRHREREVGLDQALDRRAGAECLGQLAGVAAELERQREAPADVGQTLGQAAAPPRGSGNRPRQGPGPHAPAAGAATGDRRSAARQPGLAWSGTCNWVMRCIWWPRSPPEPVQSAHAPAEFMPATLVSVATLLLGAAILLLGNGLLGILLPVRASFEHFSTTSIGLIASGYSAGFVHRLSRHAARRPAGRPYPDLRGHGGDRRGGRPDHAARDPARWSGSSCA